ncbi:2-oxoacid:ferredoxin oxidoreductase subunit gamma, partial [Caldanaerobacter subterraneus]|nr:2-oxoacid:ferredoxin oxidoreductase subunit gamma [Caldanaerobacter subterraneus]
VIAEITKIVSEKSLEMAVLKRVPAGTEELNRKALEEGFKLGKKN